MANTGIFILVVVLLVTHAQTGIAVALIGASANVVGTAISEREGYPIGWGRFMKYAAPSMIMTIALIHFLLIVRYI